MGFRETFCHLAETRGVMAEISRQTGISKAILCRYKDGVAPSFDNAILIADFFGVSLDWLAGRSADPVLHAGDDCAARVVLASYEVMGPAGRRTLATVAKSMALDPANRDAKPAARQRD